MVPMSRERFARKFRQHRDDRGGLTVNVTEKELGSAREGFGKECRPRSRDADKPHAANPSRQPLVDQGQGPGANDAADAQAVGITASWVVCLSGGRLVNDQFVGLSFFVYGPLATSCELVYNIKADQPDPQNPGQMVPPPYADAKVWGDYGQSACP
jgi:hypothetical protein